MKKPIYTFCKVTLFFWGLQILSMMLLYVSQNDYLYFTIWRIISVCELIFVPIGFMSVLMTERPEITSEEQKRKAKRLLKRIDKERW